MEHITLTTSDNIKIIADYWQGSNERGVLLLHMMPSTKESWEPLVSKLHVFGLHVLAIDLRGHGESQGGPSGYQSFTDEQHQKSIHDVEAAAIFLQEKGIKELSLIGASIGANLAIWYAAEHKQVKYVALLSAGTDYKGIVTGPLVRKLSAGIRVLFVASEDDERSGGNNAEMNRVLYEMMPDGIKKKLLIYQSAGHGTDMFWKEKPDLIEEIIHWINAQ